MVRTHGPSLKGTRLVAKVPHGPINGDVFWAYIQQLLSPLLPTKDIVIVDNLSSHKRAGVREAIEGAGATLMYLPPYSPDRNPIEMAFSKFKRLLRTAAERGVETL